MGVTYYKLEQRYEGDRTKGCGLTTAEMDENFHFLRGYDIKDAYFEDGILTLERVNCDKIEVEGIPEYIRGIASEMMDGFDPEINLTGSTFNEVTGVLTIMVNGEPYEISGFLTPDYDFKLYVGYGLDGRGTIANPLRVSHVNDTGFLAPVERILGEGESLPDSNVRGNRRYITKEKRSPYGLLYSAEDALEIDEWLQEHARGWRVPTIEEWNEMLDALECSDNDRNHNKENAGDGEELGAAAARFLKAEEFNDEPELNDFNALPIFWGQDSHTREDILTAGFWSRTLSESDGSLKGKDLHQYEDKVVHVNERYNHATLKSIRLIKDVEYNSYEDEEIGGITYKTVPMPAYKDGAVYATKLWLAENLRLDIVDGVEPVEPKGRGYYLENDEAYNKTTSDVYYVNMWDPFDRKWAKRELQENEVFIVNDYDGSGNSEELIVLVDSDGNQTLVPHLQDVRDEFAQLHEDLENETAERTAADEALDNKINELSAGTENKISELSAGTEERIDNLTDELNNTASGLSEEIAQLSADTAESLENLAHGAGEQFANLSGKTNELSERIDRLSADTESNFEEVKEDIQDINDELDTIKTKTVDENNPLISLDENGAISSDFDVEYKEINGEKLILFYGKDGKNGNPIASLDATKFVVDGMVSDVRIEQRDEKPYLVIDFNTDSGIEDIAIPLTAFAQVYKGSEYIIIDNDYKIIAKVGQNGLATERDVHDAKDELEGEIENLRDALDSLSNKVGGGYTGATITYKIEELREEVAYEIAEIQENSGKVGDNIYYNGGKIISDGDSVGEALQEIVNIITDNGSGFISKNIKDKDGNVIVEDGDTVTAAAEKLLHFTENHNESLISRNIPNNDNPIILSGDTTTEAVQKIINYINNTVTTAVENLEGQVANLQDRITNLEEEGSVIKTLVGDGDIVVSEPDASGMTHISLLGVSNPNAIELDKERTLYFSFTNAPNLSAYTVENYWLSEYEYTTPPAQGENGVWKIDLNGNGIVEEGEFAEPETTVTIKIPTSAPAVYGITVAWWEQPQS